MHTPVLTDVSKETCCVRSIELRVLAQTDDQIDDRVLALQRFERLTARGLITAVRLHLALETEFLEQQLLELLRTVDVHVSVRLERLVELRDLALEVRRDVHESALVDRDTPRLHAPDRVVRRHRDLVQHRLRLVAMLQLRFEVVRGLTRRSNVTSVVLVQDVRVDVPHRVRLNVRTAATVRDVSQRIQMCVFYVEGRWTDLANLACGCEAGRWVRLVSELLLRQGQRFQSGLFMPAHSDELSDVRKVGWRRRLEKLSAEPCVEMDLLQGNTKVELDSAIIELTVLLRRRVREHDPLEHFARAFVAHAFTCPNVDDITVVWLEAEALDPEILVVHLPDGLYVVGDPCGRAVSDRTLRLERIGLRFHQRNDAIVLWVRLRGHGVLDVLRERPAIEPVPNGQPRVVHEEHGHEIPGRGHMPPVASAGLEGAHTAPEDGLGSGGAEAQDALGLVVLDRAGHVALAGFDVFVLDLLRLAADGVVHDDGCGRICLPNRCKRVPPSGSRECAARGCLHT